MIDTECVAESRRLLKAGTIVSLILAPEQGFRKLDYSIAVRKRAIEQYCAGKISYSVDIAKESERSVLRCTRLSATDAIA